MKGLEASVLAFKQIREDNPVLRLDSTYFRKTDLLLISEMKQRDYQRLAELAYITDGIHASINFEQGSGIKVISAKHPKNGSFDLSSIEEISKQSHEANPRTALRSGDVIISTVGTIGNAAVVTPELLPSNADRHVGIIRPKQNVERPISSEYLCAFLLSRFGRMQSQRETTGNVQPNLFLIKLREFMIARFSPSVEEKIVELFREARNAENRAEAETELAENTLLSALGLADWSPPEPLSYSAKFSALSASARFDAEHFKEKFFAAKKRLDGAGATEWIPLSELMGLLTNGHTPLHHDLTDGDVPFLCAEHVHDFEISYVSDKNVLAAQHRKELARTMLRNDDVLLTIKGKIGNAAIVEDLPGEANINQDVALLRLNDRLPKWWVVTYLNSFFGKLQSEQFSTGAINPFLGLSNVRRMLVPRFPEAQMSRIAEQTKQGVQAARALRRESRDLLDRAKRAVEIAIEQNEAAALAYLSAP